MGYASTKVWGGNIPASSWNKNKYSTKIISMPPFRSLNQYLVLCNNHISENKPTGILCPSKSVHVYIECMDNASKLPPLGHLKIWVIT